MNLSSNTTLGIALFCNFQGEILDCLYDSLGLYGGDDAPRSFTQLVDRGNLKKALSFLVELREKGAIFGWELNVPTDDASAPLHFAGVVSDETLLIVGAETNEALQTLYEELMRINNEQLNTLRTSIKSQASSSKSERLAEQDLYGEISRLNNELIAMQRQMAKQNAELAQLNKLKNEFLGMAAHDLRNPLHVISAFSSFMLEDTGPELDKDLREMLEIIRSSSEFMTRLVNDLLDVAKIESGKLDLHLEPTDLVALTQRIVNLNRPIATRKEIELHFETEDIPIAQVDPDKITQVLNNLISNATKYSHPQSRVDIRLAINDRHILLSVEDEGQGIPKDELVKLFRPFQRTSVTSTGGEKSTGLGLVIVKRIVEGHGGTLWLESEVGKGTVAYVSLPVNGDTVETGAPYD